MAQLIQDIQGQKVSLLFDGAVSGRGCLDRPAKTQMLR